MGARAILWANSWRKVSARRRDSGFPPVMTNEERFEQELALCNRLLESETPEAAVEPLLLVDVGAQVDREDLVTTGLAIFTDDYDELATRAQAAAVLES